ncbi:hypothetical protein [Aeromicrobium sp. Leaf245]|uniref:hypothetical protein n=1 Tax=Aeromicrobium sp. Leaf245 TaxID=1736306 RepID=UPI0006F37B64|nr:hypothetical protein [Aeromicrobium sp. Leaf245]KQO38946.1 hypothetical protein ASF05_03470 [Aeromicrobium sp. Leaf245]
MSGAAESAVRRSLLRAEISIPRLWTYALVLYVLALIGWGLLHLAGVDTRGFDGHLIGATLIVCMVLAATRLLVQFLLGLTDRT